MNTSLAIVSTMMSASEIFSCAIEDDYITADPGNRKRLIRHQSSLSISQGPTDPCHDSLSCLDDGSYQSEIWTVGEQSRQVRHNAVKPPCTSRTEVNRSARTLHAYGVPEDARTFTVAVDVLRAIAFGQKAQRAIPFVDRNDPVQYRLWAGA